MTLLLIFVRNRFNSNKKIFSITFMTYYKFHTFLDGELEYSSLNVKICDISVCIYSFRKT